MSNSLMIRKVNDIELVHGHAGAEWSCSHRELGDKLKYEAKSNYKHFISFLDGLITNDPGFRALGPVSEVADTGVTTEGNSFSRRLLVLTRKQTLYAIAKCNKPEAAALTLAMVEAFDLVLQGELTPVASLPIARAKKILRSWFDQQPPSVKRVYALADVAGTVDIVDALDVAPLLPSDTERELRQQITELDEHVAALQLTTLREVAVRTGYTDLQLRRLLKNMGYMDEHGRSTHQAEDDGVFVFVEDKWHVSLIGVINDDSKASA